MGFIADAHREWHTVHGQFVVCPLDCGATEGLEDEHIKDCGCYADDTLCPHDTREDEDPTYDPDGPHNWPEGVVEAQS